MIETRNGKLTKREIVRRIYWRGVMGVTSNEYSFSYLARRIGKTIPQMLQFVKYMRDHSGIDFYIKGRNVVFTF